MIWSYTQKTLKTPPENFRSDRFSKVEYQKTKTKTNPTYENQFFYIQIMNLPRKKPEKQVHSQSLKNEKQKPRLNLTKEFKDLYKENYRTLKKEIEDIRRQKDLPYS